MTGMPRVSRKDLPKLIAAAAGILIAVTVLYFELFSGPSTPPPPPPVVVVKTGPTSAIPGGRTVAAPPGFAVGTAQRVGTANGALDPTLHMQAMHVTESLVYTGSGRNIFAGAEPPAPPKPVAVKPAFPARPVQTVYTPPVPTGPPPPPPILLKFFGTASSPGGSRRAFLLSGDDVYLASAGDIVQRRYRVVSIGANSIVVEDLPNTNQQTLPLLPN